MKKLDMRGLSHDIVLVAFVVIFAIAGVGYVVATKAATCSTKSSPTKKCPVVAKAVPKAKCSITIPGYHSARPAVGQVLKPYVTIRNIGKVSFTVKANHTVGYYNKGVGPKGTGSTQIKSDPPSVLSGGKLSAHSSAKFPLVPQTVTYRTDGAVKGSYSVISVGSPKYSCYKNFIFPVGAFKPPPPPVNPPNVVPEVAPAPLVSE